MKTILVTGTAGFIGWKVSEFLLKDGYHVIGVDNMNDAYDVRLKQWRLGQIKDHLNFEFHKIDICDRKSMEEIFSPQSELRNPRSVGAVINLAARAGVRQSVENPWVYYETNVTGVLNLLELCKEYGIKKFVQASTSSVYGNNNSMPWREDQDTNHPLSPYAASKKAAENLCYSYHYLYGIDITVLRYFTVYGPAGRPDMSLFRFVQWISEGRPVIVYGDGTQSRDFTFVDDIARGTIKGLREVGFEIINLGSDKPLILMETIHLIEDLVGEKAKIDYRPKHPADVPATWAGIEKADRLIDWRPVHKTLDGIETLVKWYQDNQNWAKDIAT